MKKLLLSFVAIATITLSSFGQAPEAFKYQAVVRDAGGVILTNQAVGYQLTILQGSPSGTAVYTETFNPTTNGYGLVNLEIGTGATTDDFTIIDWANGPYFMETAADVTGGTSYVVMGTSQLMSVPYALYAKTSGSSIPGPEGPQGPTGNDGIDGAAGATGPQGIQGIAGTDGVDGADGAVGATGPQGIQGIAGNDGVDGADGAVGATGPQGPAGNDGQGGITTAGTNVTITGTGLAGAPYVVNATDNVDDADNDPNNELQVLSTNGDTIFISNGNYVVIDGLTNPIAIGNGVPLPFDFPDYYTYTGDCSEGNFVSQGVDTLVGFSHSYCNFNLQSGHLLHLREPGWNGTGMTPTMKITVSDTCFIQGTISGLGTNENCRATNLSAGGSATYTVAAGGGDRGYPNSGGCTTCPTGSYSVSLSYDSHLPGTTLLPGPPSYAASTSGCQNTLGLDGDDGKSVPDSTLFYAIQIRPNGLGGIHGINAGGPAPCGPSTYTGGCGGIGLEIRCRVLVFDGSIDLSGGNGRNGCSGCSIGGGGGAGGAGSLIIAADNIIENTGTIIQNGGIGGNGFNTGTKGGDGGSGDEVILEY